MALSPQRIEQAKQEAIRYLEYSTYTICLALGVDPSSATSSMEIPVPEDSHLYMAYSCLISQLSVLEELAA